MAQSTLDEMNALYKEQLAAGYTMAEAAKVIDETYGLAEETA